MQPSNNQIIRRVCATVDVFIYILLLSIFVSFFGYPMVRDYISYSTVFTEETIMYNNLPGISFVNLVAGSSTFNHGWKLNNLEVADENFIAKDICPKFYSNFTSTYREYINCIDEQAFSADDLLLSWNNGERQVGQGEGLWKSDVFWLLYGKQFHLNDSFVISSNYKKTIK